MGEPYLADPRSMVLYPPFLVASFFRTFIDFFRFWVTFHSLLAAVFMFLLMRLWTPDPSACLAAALLGAFNGFLGAHSVYPNQYATAAYVPAALYFQRRGHVPGLSITLALQWLAGYPPFMVLTMLMLLAISLNQGKSALKEMGRATLWTMGLSAMQWLPFLQLLRLSERSVVLPAGIATEFSQPISQLLKMFFIPQWIWIWPVLQVDSRMVTFYAGPICLVLAAMAFRRSVAARRIGTGVFLSLLLSLGNHLPGYRFITPLHIFRFPASWLLLASIGLALLAGKGTAQIRNETVRWILVGLIGLDLLVFRQVIQVAWMDPLYLQDPPATLADIQKAPASGRIFHPDAFFSLLLSQSLVSLEDYRFLKEALTPSYAMAFGVREVNSYQILTLKRAKQFKDRLQAEGPQSPLLQWAGVSFVVSMAKGARHLSASTFRLLRLPPPKPLAFLVNRQATDAVEVTGQRPGALALQVRRGAGMDTLVFSEVCYPGWKAMLDGRPTEIQPFEQTFLSISVPPGNHQVEFRFTPVSFWIGLAITAATILLLGIRGRQDPAWG